MGDPITPEGLSFSASSMAMGGPGLPGVFSWKRKKYAVSEVLEQWKEAGDCHHGSGERYIRKHWFRIRTTDGLEMRIYFERQRRSSGGSRWRLYSVREAQPSPAPSASREVTKASEGLSSGSRSVPRRGSPL